MITEDIENIQSKIKEMDIDGCITGSTMTGGSYDAWESVPDIDIFTYSPYAMVHALDLLQYELGMKPGGDDVASDKGEAWKLMRARKNGRGSHDISTVKMTDGSVTVNVTNRKYEHSAMDVLARFDMSIVLKAYDIPSGTLIDFTGARAKNDVSEIIGFDGGDPMVAVPNPFREFDGTTWNATKWLRQWDRVIKYANRGFDTVPMAKFYRHMIKEVIDGGCLFKTDNSKAAYDAFVEEFKELGEKIDAWIKSKE